MAKTIYNGSVIVKIYRVENKGRESLTLSPYADGKRVAALGEEPKLQFQDDVKPGYFDSL